MARPINKITCGYKLCQKEKPRKYLWYKSGETGKWFKDTWFCNHECLEKQMLSEWISWRENQKNKNYPTNRLRLGLILQEMGVITPEQLKAALEKHKRMKNVRLGYIIRQMGFATEKDITIALSKQYHSSWMELDNVKISKPLLDKLPKQIITQALILPIEFDEKENRISLAMANPGDYSTIQIIKKYLQCEITPIAVNESSIRGVIAQIFKDTLPVAHISVSTDENKELMSSVANTILSPNLRKKLSNLTIEIMDNAMLIHFELNKVNCDCFLSIQK